MLPEIQVKIPAVEVKPVIKNWLKDLYIWNEQIEEGCFIPKGWRNPCLCLLHEIEVRECLEAKIAGDVQVEVIKAFLVELLARGSLPVPTEIYIDHLEGMGLIRKTERFVRSEPLLETWPVPYLLGLIT
ncbi:hypothetical protein HY502_02225 [Candidatus Woesebacteria bacterium]|nr:hypothetical protein [Candidatus Woesebacteria bacterium]